jgi:hypothetical protein
MVHVGRKLRKMDEEAVHIAVGKNSRKEKANILWAAANFPRATIVLVHVHWPSKWMPFSKIFYNLSGKTLPLFVMQLINSFFSCFYPAAYKSNMTIRHFDPY